MLISSAITQGLIYVIRPMITYQALKLDASASTIGLIAAIYALLPVLMALSFGRWVGVIGEGRFLILGTLSMSLASTTLIFSHSIPVLAIGAALSGVSHLACMVGGQTMVSLKSEPEYYDRNFGYYTFSASLGQMLGPILGTLVAGSTGVLPRSTTAAFVGALVLSFLALVPVMGWRNSGPTVPAKKKSEGTLRSAGKLLSNRKVFGAIYMSLAISSVADILIVFLPLYGSEKDFSSYSIGAVIAIRAGASMLSRLFLGKISSRFTTKQILIVSNSISVVTCFLMGFAPSAFSLELIVLIAGLSLGVGQPLTMSLVSHATVPEERALAVSTRLTGNRLGQFIIPAGAGALASTSGTSAVFVGLSVLVASTFFTA